MSSTADSHDTEAELTRTAELVDPEVAVFLANGIERTMLLSEAVKLDKPEGVVLMHVSVTLFKLLHDAARKMLLRG